MFIAQRNAPLRSANAARRTAAHRVAWSGPMHGVWVRSSPQTFAGWSWTMQGLVRDHPGQLKFHMVPHQALYCPAPGSKRLRAGADPCAMHGSAPGDSTCCGASRRVGAEQWCVALRYIYIYIYIYMKYKVIYIYIYIYSSLLS